MHRLFASIGREWLTRERKMAAFADASDPKKKLPPEQVSIGPAAGRGVERTDSVERIQDTVRQRLGIVAPELSERVGDLQRSNEIAGFAGFDDQDEARAIASEWGLPVSDAFASGLAKWETSVSGADRTRLENELNRRRAQAVEAALRDPAIVRGLITDVNQSIERVDELATSLEQAIKLEDVETNDLAPDERAALREELEKRRELIARIPAAEVALLLANTPQSLESLTVSIGDPAARSLVREQLEMNPLDRSAISVALHLEERIPDPSQRAKVLDTLERVVSRATKTQNFGRAANPSEPIDSGTWTAWKRDYVGSLEEKSQTLQEQLHALLTARYESFIVADRERLLDIARTLGFNDDDLRKMEQGNAAAIEEAERRSLLRFGVGFSSFCNRTQERAWAATCMDHMALQTPGDEHLPRPSDPDFLTRADQMFAEIERMESERERLDLSIEGFADDLLIEQEAAEAKAASLARRVRTLMGKASLTPLPGIGDPTHALRDIDGEIGKYADATDTKIFRGDYPRCVTAQVVGAEEWEQRERLIELVESASMTFHEQRSRIEECERREGETSAPLETIERDQLDVRAKLSEILDGIIPSLDAPICRVLHLDRALKDKGSYLEGMLMRAAGSAEKARKTTDDAALHERLSKLARRDWTQAHMEMEQLEHVRETLVALTPEHAVYEQDGAFPTAHEQGFFDIADGKIHLRHSLRGDENVERRQAAWLHEKGHATLHLLRESGVLPFFLLATEHDLAERLPEGERDAFETLLSELTAYYHIDALRGEFRRQAQERFPDSTVLAEQEAHKLEREYLLEELYSRFADARDLPRPAVTDTDPQRTAKLAEARVFDLLREGTVPRGIEPTSAGRALRSGRLYTAGAHATDHDEADGAPDFVSAGADESDELSNIKEALNVTTAKLYKATSFIDVYNDSAEPEQRQFIDRNRTEIAVLNEEVKNFEKRFSLGKPVSLVEIDGLKARASELAREASDLDREAWDIRKQKPVKRITWWDRIQWMSINDVVHLWKDTMEDFKTIYKRNQQRLLQDVGNVLNDALTKGAGNLPVVGKKYFSKLRGYHERRYADAELESVGKWKKAMDKLDTHQVLHILSSTKNLDQIRGCIEMICDRGEMDWNNKGVWKTLEKVSGFRMPMKACLRDDILRDTWLRKMISKTWKDAELFYKWRMNNDSNTESHKKKFVQQVDQFSNVSGGLSGNLKRQLQLWNEWHAEEHYNEDHGLPPPKFPDDVKPHMYEEVIEYSIKNGKMTMEDKMFYIVQGVASGILPIERLRALAGQHGSIINLFPYIEYFYGHNNTLPEIQALAERLTERDADGNPTYKPGLRTTLWIHFEVSRDEQVRRRLSKGSTRKAEDIDHEDIPFFVTQMDYSEMSNMLDVISGGRQKVTPEGLKNAYVGFNSRMKIFGNLALMERDHLDRFTGEDAKTVAKNLAAYILMDNSLTLNGQATGKKPPSLALSQFMTQAVSSPNGETAWQYREKMTKFIQALNKHGVFDGDIKWGGDPTKDRQSLGVSKDSMLALDESDPNQGYQRNSEADAKKILSDAVFPKFAQQLEKAIKSHLHEFKEVLKEFSEQFLDECGSEGLTYKQVKAIKIADRRSGGQGHGGH